MVNCNDILRIFIFQILWNGYNFGGVTYRIYSFMTISKSDVETIASLAHLEFESDDRKELADELNGIFEMIQHMQQFDTSTVVPMSHPQDIELRLREDEVTEPDQRCDLQTIAPETYNGFYMVPKVLD